MTFKNLFLATLGVLVISCSQNENSTTTVASADETVVKVDSSYFISDSLAEPVTTVTCTLSDGTTANCYKIVNKSAPTDYTPGPWCPTNITDDASNGGIWLENGNVYDVSGDFIKNLATFYNDNTWQMYKTTTGVITRTKTEVQCREAANPNVGAQYKNYCVECLPSYVSSIESTTYIPITPKKLSASIKFGTGRGSKGPTKRGVAFNGVVFDAPAPVDAILGAYTIAPFDDAGGHINLHAGYHYHSANGKTKKIPQPDGYAAMIGYALDGYAIYETLDAKGNEATDLDDNRGRYDEKRGYHYRVDKAGSNNFINGLRGAYAQ